MTGVEAIKSTLSHPALTVKARLGALVHSRKYYQVGSMSPPNNYLVHNSSINNLVRGVLTRVFYVKGKPKPMPPVGIYVERLRKFRSLMFNLLPSTTPVDYAGFLRYYKGRKLQVYTKAVESLLTSGVTRRDADIKAFVKAEFINSDDKPDPDPRIISPREPRYNVEVGRYLRPLEHQVYRAIADIYGEPTVAKGFNSAQLGEIIGAKWDKYTSPVAVGLDASRFDQHVSVQALKWEHSIYNGVFKDKHLATLLSWQLRNNVRGYCRDGSLKYKVDGCRMSGDVNTALGNCLLMCALVYAYAEHVGVKLSLINNGDDCVVIFEKQYLEQFCVGLDAWFLEMGFNMKVEPPVYEISQIEFCQTHPIWTPDGYIMVRNFPKSLAKDCLSLKQLGSRAMSKAWIDAVGQGGLSMSGGIPIMQEFYSAYIRNASQIDLESRRHFNSKRRHKNIEIEGGLSWLSGGMKRHYSHVHPRTRHSFYIAFGIQPDQQENIEAYYRNVEFGVRVGRDRPDLLPSWF